jgi:glutamine amidotransferase
MVVIIDYGVGNTGSILNMIKKLGYECLLTKDVEIVENASHIILPGVGSFDNAMLKLTDTGLVPFLTDLALVKKRPILGICLGMQMFFKYSEEGNSPGLNWLDGRVVKFDNKIMGSLKIPHMGWNTVMPCNSSILFLDQKEEYRFYFTHSFYVDEVKDENVVGKTNYGRDFICAINSENIFGVQFHPEKSHKFGLDLIHSFISL